jgi:hypothetical protein
MFADAPQEELEVLSDVQKEAVAPLIAVLTVLAFAVLLIALLLADILIFRG